MTRWTIAGVVSFATATVLLVSGTPATAAATTVPLGTSSDYSVLAGQTVTNTGASVLNGSLGLDPGTDTPGFPPGLVTGRTDIHNAVSLQAQADLTIAYDNAAGQGPATPTGADLGGQTLTAGVYTATNRGTALQLTGPLILSGDPSSVFIFQTDAALTVATGASVTMTGGAQECNVFWQIGSSATLFTGSTFVGNILALTSIAVQDSVTVHGRALARNGSVTLINDTFTSPTCEGVTGGAPTATTAAATTTVAPTTVPPATTVAPATTVVLPRTGGPARTDFLLATGVLALGAVAMKVARRRPLPNR